LRDLGGNAAQRGALLLRLAGFESLLGDQRLKD